MNNGMTLTGMSAASHMKITGVLAGGSRVSVTSGQYTFANVDPSSFLQITSSLAITDASALDITGAFFTVPSSFTAGGKLSLYSQATRPSPSLSRVL